MGGSASEKCRRFATGPHPNPLPEGEGHLESGIRFPDRLLVVSGWARRGTAALGRARSKCS